MVQNEHKWIVHCKNKKKKKNKNMQNKLFLVGERKSV